VRSTLDRRPPEQPLSIEITFVRHAETDANAAGVWQGHGNHLLSELGERQAGALRQRLAGKEFDFVYASDLPRVLQTAELAGLDPIPDDAWREIDIGRWQGLTREEVDRLYPEESAALREGRPVQMGGGESWDAFSARVAVALAGLVHRTPPGSRVLVVTHGGIVHSVVGSGLQVTGRGRTWPLERVRNASVTEVIASPERFHLHSYNDARHAFPEPTGPDTISLVRHGETIANQEGRWHGTTDGPLSEQGILQIESFAAAHDGANRVFASPLERARRTAEAYARRHGLVACLDPALIEIDFAAWEGLTTAEIERRFPDEWHAVFEGGADLPRGGAGETFAGAGLRMLRAVSALVEASPGRCLAVFSHGGSIWALAARVVGLPWPRYRSLGLPTNTSLTRVQLANGGVRLVDYNLPLR
jgi:broad specificity phosphatase PhoE